MKIKITENQLKSLIKKTEVLNEGSYTGISDMIITLDYDNEITKIEDKHYHHGPDDSIDYEIDTITSDFDYDDTMEIVKELLEKDKYRKIILNITHNEEDMTDTFDMGNWRGISYWIK